LTKKHVKKDGSVNPENLKISYKFEVYVENMRFDVSAEKEIIVKQFLFTENEINEDLNVQQKILQI